MRNVYLGTLYFVCVGSLWLYFVCGNDCLFWVLVGIDMVVGRGG